MKNRLFGTCSFALGILLASLIWSSPMQAQTAIPCVNSAEIPPAETAPEQTSESAPPTPTPSTPEEPLAALRFNEVLSDPLGSDADGEFIEVANAGTGDADARGWTVVASSGKAFALTMTVPGGGAYALSHVETKIPLVNGGTTLTLRAPDGTTIDTLTYPAAKTGQAYARTVDGAWLWTPIATPGTANAFAQAAVVATPPPASETPAPEPAPTTAEPPTSTPPQPTPATPDAIVHAATIAEFLPDPDGDDAGEWITLENASDADIALDGLLLDDADGGSTPFPLSGRRIAARGRLIVPKSESRIALNNDGDEVRLLRADGTVAASVSYALAPRGKTYSFIGGRWQWSGSAMEESPSGNDAAPTPADATVTTRTEDVPPDVPLGDIDPDDDDAVFSTEGTVTAAFGVLGKRTFAMQDGEGAGAIVRAYGNGTLPSIAVGDRVRVSGRMRGDTGARFIGTTARMIARTGKGSVKPAGRDVDELNAEHGGLAVRVSGTLIGRASRSITIADTMLRAEITVRPDRVPTKDDLPDGAEVVVRGVVRPRQQGIELVAATVESFVPVPKEQETPKKEAPEPRKSTTIFADPKPQVTLPIVIGAAGATTGTAATIAFLRRRRAAGTKASGLDG